MNKRFCGEMFVLTSTIAENDPTRLQSIVHGRSITLTGVSVVSVASYLARK